MTAKPPFTSRQTVLRPNDPPNKRQMTVEDMLKAAYDPGTGKKIRDVASESTWSPTSIYRVKAVATGRVQTVEELNYDRSLLCHFIAFCLLENPLTTGQNISTKAQEIGMKTSVSTVNRIAKEMNFVSVLTQKQEKLTDRQKEYRVKFCNDVRLWFGFLLPWVFTDESMLVLNPVKRRIRLIRGIDLPAKFMEVTGYPVKIMVWGAVGRGFKSPLLRVTKSLTAMEYQNLLESGRVFELLNERYGQFAYIFQQDGARPHTAKSTIAFLRERAEILPEHIHWPASSPDLNVIENLWSIMKYRMRYDVIHDGDSMFSEASRVWQEISMTVIDNLVAEFSPRLHTCVAVGGECLNRYKSVLRGFRSSYDEGCKALADARKVRSDIGEFVEKSRLFFSERVQKYVCWDDLDKDHAVRGRQLEMNELIGIESQTICHALPAKVQRTCRLPEKPVVVAKRVPVRANCLELT